MRVRINKSTKWFFSLFLMSCVLAIVCNFLLPEKFFYDAKLIVEDPYNEKGFIKSYPITMMFYSITGLGKLPFFVVGLIQLVIYFYWLAKIRIPKTFHKITLDNIFIYSLLLMMSIFIAMPSKELITFSFIAILILLNRKMDFMLYIIISIIMLVVFGVLFRIYFALIPVMSIPLFLIANIKKENRMLIVIFLSILLIGVISSLFSFISGESFSDMSKYSLNIERLYSEDANSMILPPFPQSNIFGEIINSINGYISVNFPINALKHYDTPRIIVFVIWQLFFTTIVVLRLNQLFLHKTKYPKVLWLGIILISYMSIQGIFEPDLGSAIRHKIGILPLFYYIFYYDKIK